MTTDEVMKIIVADPYANVTFSGGDPLYQAEGFTELARAIRSQTQKTIWCYTGFLWEDIVGIPKYMCIIKNIDVLVDGEFVIDLKNPNLRFRGSSNQRVILVQESIKEDKIIQWDDGEGLELQ